MVLSYSAKHPLPIQVMSSEFVNFASRLGAKINKVVQQHALIWIQHLQKYILMKQMLRLLFGYLRKCHSPRHNQFLFSTSSR